MDQNEIMRFNKIGALLQSANLIVQLANAEYQDLALLINQREQQAKLKDVNVSCSGS